MSVETALWIGIAFCISQSAMFSGLNLAFFSLSRLQLEVESTNGNETAQKILALRQDSNFLLTTILWGNVSINVLLTLLSDSALAGISAFLFSTIFITIFGEILPQAYFSRNAFKMASLLTPVLRIYQFILFPVAKPCSLILDSWLGKEGIVFFREKELVGILQTHVESEEAELEQIEGIGALNFLKLDDVRVVEEGELVDEASILRLPTKLDFPLIPEITRSADDEFLKQIHASGHHWVVLANLQGEPLLLLDADGALRAALMEIGQPFDLYSYCTRPLVIRDGSKTLTDVISSLKSLPNLSESEDGAIDYDAVLIWNDERRIITGADILGKLLKGISAEASPSLSSAP